MKHVNLPCHAVYDKRQHTINCGYCKKPFEVYVHIVEDFCSDKCEKLARKTNTYDGKLAVGRNPDSGTLYIHDTRQHTIPCDYCRKPFKVHISNDHGCCSADCYQNLQKTETYNEESEPRLKRLGSTPFFTLADASVEEEKDNPNARCPYCKKLFFSKDTNYCSYECCENFFTKKTYDVDDPVEEEQDSDNFQHDGRADDQPDSQLDDGIPNRNLWMGEPKLTDEEYKQSILGKLADVEAQVAEAERKGVPIDESKVMYIKEDLYEKLFGGPKN